MENYLRSFTDELAFFFYDLGNKSSDVKKKSFSIEARFLLIRPF